MEPPIRLVVVAKRPDAGRVKTRLSPPLTRAEAARLYEALLLDTVDLAARVPGARIVVAYSPPGAERWFRERMPPGTVLLPQHGRDLGERLAGVFRELFRAGGSPVCIMNSDGPDLPLTHLEAAFRLLVGGEADVVFGPNPDGGYYLVGLRRPADIFGGIPWSTERVLRESLAAAREAGLAAALLPPWPDLDTPDDLQEALRRWKGGRVIPPPRTYALLQEFMGG